MYTWKVIHNIYPNPGLHLNHSTSDHQAHPNHGVAMDLTNSEEILVHHGPTLPGWLAGKSILEGCCELFNSLPRQLRVVLPTDEEPSFPRFKTLLDEWLETIPDRPISARRPRTAKSNSIIDMKSHINQWTTTYKMYKQMSDLQQNFVFFSHSRRSGRFYFYVLAQRARGRGESGSDGCHAQRVTVTFLDGASLDHLCHPVR